MFGGGRGSIPRPYIFYALSLPTELRSQEAIHCIFRIKVDYCPILYRYEIHALYRGLL